MKCQWQELMANQDSAKLKRVSASFPFGFGGAVWVADETEGKAAWLLYVEIVTRITLQLLEVDQGFRRESLQSV